MPPKTIRCRFGHRIYMKPGWPSTAGMDILRRHYKKYHPAAFKELIRKAKYTRAARRVFK